MQHLSERPSVVFPLVGDIHRTEKHVTRLRRAIIIKDVLEFYGILFNRKKSQPQQILNIYENEKNIYNRISNYLEKLNSI